MDLDCSCGVGMTEADKLAVLKSSERQDWRTPEILLALVRGLGTIGLDPCAAYEKRHHFAAYNVTEEDGDGLDVDWAQLVGDDALVFVNPPYGRELSDWVDACVYEADRGAEIILLAPSRTDTRWFRCATQSADARCLLYGRLTFEGAENSAPFPSAVWYFGQQHYQFCAVFADAGEVACL